MQGSENMKNFKLKEFDMPVNVTRIANVHYFEFVNLYNTKSDSHNFYEIVYVDNGSIKVCADNYTGILSSGQMIMHSPCEKHSLMCEGEASPNVIIIGFECDCEELDAFSVSPTILNDTQKKLLSDAIKEDITTGKS